jgi:hypothetical protein
LEKEKKEQEEKDICEVDLEKKYIEGSSCKGRGGSGRRCNQAEGKVPPLDSMSPEPIELVMY